jgi:hypothetical protein
MDAGWFMKIKLDPAATAAELAKLIPENAYNPG